MVLLAETSTPNSLKVRLAVFPGTPHLRGRLDNMSETAIPDVSDPDIREMVLRDHEPKEAWTLGGQLVSVHCDTCFRPWPCPSIKAARAAEENR